MRMRLKPRRGEMLQTLVGITVTVLRDIGHTHLEVVLPDGRTSLMLKTEVKLPEIETTDYERM